MSLANTRTSYGVLTRLLHWGVALTIIALIGIGFWMVDLTYYDPWYNRALALHKGLGMLALVLGVSKVLWVLANTRVNYLESLSDLDRRAAAIVHRLFLLAMVLVPVTGYLVSTSKGDGIDVFGWFSVPAVWVVGEQLRDLAIETHYYLAYGVGVLAIVHGAAAIKHQLIDGDGTLRRMLW